MSLPDIDFGGHVTLTDEGETDQPTMSPKMKARVLSVVQAIAGVTLESIIASMPKGATPNCYKPHQGAKEMARRRKQMKGQA